MSSNLKKHQFRDRRSQYIGKRVRKDANTPGLLEQEKFDLERPEHCDRPAAGKIISWDTPRLRKGRRQATRNYLVFFVEFEDGDKGNFFLDEIKAILTEPAPEVPEISSSSEEEEEEEEEEK